MKRILFILAFTFTFLLMFGMHEAKVAEAITCQSITASYSTSANSFWVNANGCSDPNGVALIRFPTWTLNNGQDDLIWYSGTLSGGSNWSYTVPISEHNNETGVYDTDVWGYNNAGGYNYIGTIYITVDHTPPNIGGFSTNFATNGTTYRIWAYNVTDSESGVQVVKFPTWLGGTTPIWQDGTNGGNGNWYLDVPVSNYGNAEGYYYTDYYAYDNVGNRSGAGRTTVTVDWTPPNGMFSPNSSSWTTSVNPTFTPSDSLSGVKQWRYRTSSDNGTTWGAWSTYITSGASSSIPIGSTGTWKIQSEVTDNAGNIATVTSGTFNVDATAPSGTFSPSSNSTWAKSQSSTFTPNDTGGSGVKQWRYRTSSDNGVTYGSWSSYITGASASSITASSTGTWKIQSEVTDNAGNIATVTSGTFNVDTTAPSGTFSPNSNSTWATSQSSTFTPGDTGGSSIKQWRYRTSGDNGTTYGSWSSYITGASASSITVSTSGYWKMQVEITDNAGNIATVTSGTFNVDTTPPTGTITENTTNWAQTITLTASGSDSMSGMYEIKNPDGSYTVGATSTYSVNTDGTYSFTFIDNLGNTFTKSITVSNIDTTPPFAWGENLSPNTPTNQNVTIYENGGDMDSGVNHIVLPNGTSVYALNATYTVSSNGTYKFTIVDNVGLTYDDYVTVSNIDKTNPTLNDLTIVKQNNTYQVTVKTSDANGISSVALNSGQVINKASDGDYYFIQGLTSLPSYVKITDGTGNYVNYYFLDIPTNNYSSSGTTNQDVSISISGSSTLSYKVNYQTYTCSGNPCTFSVSMNSTITALNQSGSKTAMSIFNVSNIDKTETNFALSGTRSTSNSSVINLTWNQTLSSGTLTCDTPDGQSTFSVSGTSYSINGKNYQYNCQVIGTSNGTSVQSNWLLIDANTQDGTMVVTKPTDNIPTESFGNNVNVYVEKNPLGEFYIINTTTQNDGLVSVPVPSYIQ